MISPRKILWLSKLRIYVINSSNTIMKINRIFSLFLFFIFGVLVYPLSGSEIQIKKENRPPAEQPKFVNGNQIVKIGFDPWQIDFLAFRRGMGLLQASSPDYLQAISSFEEIIKKNPDAKDIDYPMGWALFCEAKAGKLKEALLRYRVFREKYHGWQEGGASGAVRLWDTKLDEIKEIVKSSNFEKKMEIWQEMRDLDLECEKKHGKPGPSIKE